MGKKALSRHTGLFIGKTYQYLTVLPRNKEENTNLVEFMPSCAGVSLELICQVTNNFNTKVIFFVMLNC